MNKNSSNILKFIMFLVGIIVSLAVGFALVNNVFTIPFIPALALTITGWVVVGCTILSVLAGIYNTIIK